MLSLGVVRASPVSVLLTNDLRLASTARVAWRHFGRAVTPLLAPSLHPFPSDRNLMVGMGKRWRRESNRQ